MLTEDFPLTFFAVALCGTAGAGWGDDLALI